MRNSEFFGEKLPSELVFVVVSIIDRGVGPAVGTTDGDYLVAVLRGDGDATRHLDLIIGAEFGARTSYDILAVGVDNTIYCFVFIYDIFVNITIYTYIPSFIADPLITARQNQGCRHYPI